MPSYDFFAPFCRVALVLPDESRLPLWFGVDALKDAAKFDYADAPQAGGLGTNLAIVNNVEIEQSLGNFFVVTVTCSPTFEDAMALFESTAIRTAETLLEVQYGYVADGGELSTRIFVGLLTDPDFSIGPEISVTLKAQCTCMASMYGSSTVDVERAKLKLTRKAWIELIAQGAGSEARDVKVDFSSVKGTRELELLNEIVPFSMAGKNDNIALRNFIEDCLCEVYYVPNPDKPRSPNLRVIDRHTRFGATGNKVFQLYGFGTRGNTGLGGELNAGGFYPITGVTTQSKQVFIRGVIHGTTRVKVDETKKKDPKLVTTQADSTGLDVLPPEGSPKGEGAKGPKASKAAPGAKNEGGVTTGGTMTTTGDESFATQKAAHESQELAQFIQSGIQLSVESLGVPDLEPGAIVKVQGLGTRFSGDYSVLKVIHTIGEGGYTTRWDGINNAGYLTGLEDKMKAKVKAIVEAREADARVEVQAKEQPQQADAKGAAAKKKKGA